MRRLKEALRLLHAQPGYSVYKAILVISRMKSGLEDVASLLKRMYEPLDTAVNVWFYLTLIF